MLNVLLQVLDEGRLTDGRGRTVDFTNTILILTSNVGAMTLLAGVDPITAKIPPAVEAQVMNEIRAQFKPELLNRLDDIILFQVSAAMGREARGGGGVTCSGRIIHADEPMLSLFFLSRSTRRISRRSCTSNWPICRID